MDTSCLLLFFVYAKVSELSVWWKSMTTREWRMYFNINDQILQGLKLFKPETELRDDLLLPFRYMIK